jgi:intracellular sulfur oxidation DsrE/DsrF family protein
MIRRHFLQFVIPVVALLGAGAAPAALAIEAAKDQVIIQVSDGDPKTWNQALNVVRNIQSERGKDNVKVELVVFGHAADMLKFDSPLAGRITETLASGADVVMCQNTMRGRKLTEKDMHPTIGYVKAGVIEIIDKQKQGWVLLRP